MAAYCEICHLHIETHNYVRAKAMVPKGQNPQGRTIYKAVPNDEHLFFGIDEPRYEYRDAVVDGNPVDGEMLLASMCKGHSEDAIAAAIESSLPPAAGAPVQLLFNPNRNHIPLRNRRRRVIAALETRYGPATDASENKMRETMIRMACDDEDIRQNVKMNRLPGENDGLRFITIDNPALLAGALYALLGETGV